MKPGEATIALIRIVIDGDLTQINSAAQQLRETTTLEEISSLAHWLNIWGFEW